MTFYLHIQLSLVQHEFERAGTLLHRFLTIHIPLTLYIPAFKSTDADGPLYILFNATLQKGLQHLWVLVSTEGRRTSHLPIARDKLSFGLYITCRFSTVCLLVSLTPLHCLRVNCTTFIKPLFYILANSQLFFKNTLRHYFFEDDLFLHQVL